MGHHTHVWMNPLHVTLGSRDAAFNDTFKQGSLADVALVISLVGRQSRRRGIANYKGRAKEKQKDNMNKGKGDEERRRKRGRKCEL